MDIQVSNFRHFFVKLCLIVIPVSALVSVEPANSSVGIPPLVWNASLTTSTLNPQGTGQINSIDCPSVSVCVSGGFVTNSKGQQAYVDVRKSGADAEAILGVNLNTGNVAEINSVSCASTTLCFAAGEVSIAEAWSYSPLLAQWNGTEWSTVSIAGTVDFSGGAKLTSIDCVSATFCAAVGDYNTNSGMQGALGFAATWNGTVWTATAIAQDLPALNSGAAVNVNALSCVSSEFCVAVGTTGGGVQPLIETWGGSQWSGALFGVSQNAGNRGSLNSVSCVSASFCVVGGYVSDAWSNQYPIRGEWNGVNWNATEVTLINGENPSGVIKSVSCASVNRCLAVGSSFTMLYDGTAWTNSIHYPVNYQTNGGSFIYKGAYCINDTLCLAVGQSISANSMYNNSALLISTWTSGSWSDSTSVLSGVYYDWLGPMSCPTATYCLSGGVFARSYQGTNSYQPLLVEAVPPTVPAAPMSVVATPGNGALAISWRAPNSGGLPITGYTATDGNGHSCTSVTTSCQISGLTAGTSYSITVSATNAVGTSFDSAAVSATPYGVASTPRTLSLGSVMYAGYSAITVSWQAPIFDGATPILNYRVTTQPVTSRGNGVCVTSSLTCVISGTSPGVQYAVSVVAQNAAGTSTALTGTITAQSAPSSPQNLAIIPSIGGATVSWNPPAVLGGSPLTGYTVKVGTSTYFTTKSSISLKNLSSTAPVQVSVAAVNAIGSSTPTVSDSFYAWSGPNASPALLVTPTVLATGASSTVLVNSTLRNSSLNVAWTGQPHGSCFTNDAGQCVVNVTPNSPGTFALVVSGGSMKPLSMIIYEPGLQLPQQVKRGSTVSVTVKYCPPGSKVTLNVSDGRKFSATASAAGQSTIAVTLTKPGSTTVSLSVGAVINLATRSVVVY